MPGAFTKLTARTAFQILRALHSVFGQTKKLRAMNDAIDAAVAEVKKLSAEDHLKKDR